MLLGWVWGFLLSISFNYLDGSEEASEELSCRWINTFASGPGSKTFLQIFSKFQNCKISPDLPTRNWNCIGILNAYIYVCNYRYMHIYMHTLLHFQNSQWFSYHPLQNKRIWNQMLPDRLLFHKAVATNTKNNKLGFGIFSKNKILPSPRSCLQKRCF